MVLFSFFSSGPETNDGFVSLGSCGSLDPIQMKDPPTLQPHRHHTIDIHLRAPHRVNIGKAALRQMFWDQPGGRPN